MKKSNFFPHWYAGNTRYWIFNRLQPNIGTHLIHRINDGITVVIKSLGGPKNIFRFFLFNQSIRCQECSSWFPRAQRDISEVLLYSNQTAKNPKTLHLLSLRHKKQQILTFKELEPVYVWHVYLKSDWNDKSSIKERVRYFSFDRLIN